MLRASHAVAHHPCHLHGRIEFRDLVFSYGDTVVLDHVSATIETGQTVALARPGAVMPDGTTQP